MVLPLLESDLLTDMQAVAAEKLADVEVKFSDKAAYCVIMASAGYPQSYEKGFPITLPEKDQLIFVAGAKAADGKLLTNGGRRGAWCYGKLRTPCRKQSQNPMKL